MTPPKDLFQLLYWGRYLHSVKPKAACFTEMGPANLAHAGPYSCKACNLRLVPTFKTLHVHHDNDKVLDFHQLT
jgi:hypothetical protein